MPQIQMIDMSPTPQTTETPLEKTLGAFTSRYRENQEREKSSDALKQIYERYQTDGKNIENALFSINTSTEMSPTDKVSSTNQMMQMQKFNADLQNQALSQAKKAEADERKLQASAREVRGTEQRFGLEPGDLSAYESNPAHALSVAKTISRTAEKKIEEKAKSEEESRVSQVIATTLASPDLKSKAALDIYKELVDKGIPPNRAEFVANHMRYIDREGRLTSDYISKRYDEKLKENQRESSSALTNRERQRLKSEREAIVASRNKDIRKYKLGASEEQLDIFADEFSAAEGQGQQDNVPSRQAQQERLDRQEAQIQKLLQQPVHQQLIQELDSEIPPNEVSAGTSLWVDAENSPDGQKHKYISDGTRWVPAQ